MVNKKAKGKRAKTRKKFKRRDRPLTINRMLPNFDIGQTVQIVVDPSVHSGLPHHRLQGITGKITSRQGKVYFVSLKNMKKELNVLVHPAHLKAIKTIEKTEEKVEEKLEKKIEEKVAA